MRASAWVKGGSGSAGVSSVESSPEAIIFSFTCSVVVPIGVREVVVPSGRPTSSSEPTSHVMVEGKELTALWDQVDV